MSIRKRNFTELRRSQRDRHACYQTLDERVMGIRHDSVIFQQICEPDRHFRHSRNYSSRSSKVYRSCNEEELDTARIYSNRDLRSRNHYRRIIDEDENEVEVNNDERDRDNEEMDLSNEDAGDSGQEDNNVKRSLRNRNKTFHRHEQYERKKTRRGSSDLIVENGGEVVIDNGGKPQQFIPTMYERIKSRHQNGVVDGLKNGELDGENTDDDKPKRGRGRSKVVIETDDVEDDLEEDKEMDADEDDEDVNRPYRLRQRRQQVTRFDYKRDFPRACRASSLYNGVYADNATNSGVGGKSRGGKRRGLYRRQRSRLSSSSSSSTSTSSDDEDDQRIRSAHNDLKEEARFERRKLRSLHKGRLALMPTNMTGKEFKSSVMEVRQKVRNAKATGADIDPMEMDSKTSFTDVGGLTHHIQSLKEVIVFPLLYPELFEHFDVTPPRGVLFYGPPGTGKTLIARALANECSRGDKKVAFFMRKGADCLSKWVGESERQLRLLFDQAHSMRPSIIFFDEIDGLAPVRSSRQDQIHSSIVSTLLALMDGLDKRGEIIVIGATNRLDSIDPALRRPGRFDRELSFDLPDAIARQSILQIHTRSWKDSCPDQATYEWLAENTSGYCGADLRSLCTEAVLIALRERFPHIYLSNEKLLIDPSSVCIEKRHFEDAMRLIVPAARRDFSVISHRMSPRLSCFIEPVVAEFMRRLPVGYGKRNNVENLCGGNELERVVMALKIPSSVPACRILLHGKGALGQTTHFLPVFVNQLDHLPVFSLACEQIFTHGHPDENVAQVLRSALRATANNTPVVLLMPDVDVIESILPPAAWKTLLSSMHSFTGFTSVLVIGSVQQSYDNCSEDLKKIFRHQNTFEIVCPNDSQRFEYFDNLIQKCYEPPDLFDVSKFPCPPIAPKSLPIRKVSVEEYKELKLMYEQTQRQFRIFLRELLGRLVRDRRFNVFNLPVDKEDAEDYYDIIKEPMCLSQMMEKIDFQAYSKREDFMADICLIKANALEYNPNRNMEDKTIRHNATALLDMAEALFDADFDDGLSNKMEEMGKLLEEAKKGLPDQQTNDNANLDENRTADSKIIDGDDITGDKSEVQLNESQTKEINVEKNILNRKRRRSRNGYNFTPLKRRLSSSIIKKYKTIRTTNSNEEETPSASKSGMTSNSLSEKNERVNMNSQMVNLPNVQPATVSKSSENSKSCINGLLAKGNVSTNQPEESFLTKNVSIDRDKLDSLLNMVVKKTSGWSAPDIENIGVQIVQCIEMYRNKWEREKLLQKLFDIVKVFKL